MRLIDADVLKEIIEHQQTINPKLSVYDVIKVIDNAPTVEWQMGRMTNGIIIPIERPQGRWNVISLLDDYVYLRCSECGQSTRLVRDAKNEFCCIKDVRDKIIACPYCGAKIMKGGKE